jgi:diaminohydroxyphosphoribosylaminopyrimidine deaminase / 5-amino-6-(5-phosphoribosylamino)uracil reductase
MGGAAPDLPWVTIKYAQTLDGRIATRSGESQWISSSDSLVYAHELRAAHDAVLVGVGTVLRDNPKLTVRLVDGPDPLRVVADSSLRTPLDTALLNPPPNVLFAVTAAATPERRAAFEARGAQVVVLPAQEQGHVVLEALLAELVRRGIRSVLVEGGAEMITALLRRRLAHRLVVCIAPKVLGTGVEGVGDLDISRLGDALTFHNNGFRLCGADVLFEGDVENAYPALYPAPTAARAAGPR